MPPRRAVWFLTAVLVGLRPPAAGAQQFPQTREPPLADAPGAIQQAAATQPLPPLPPGPRPADLPAVGGESLRRLPGGARDEQRSGNENRNHAPGGPHQSNSSVAFASTPEGIDFSLKCSSAS